MFIKYMSFQQWDLIWKTIRLTLMAGKLAENRPRPRHRLLSTKQRMFFESHRSPDDRRDVWLSWMYAKSPRKTYQNIPRTCAQTTGIRSRSTGDLQRTLVRRLCTRQSVNLDFVGGSRPGRVSPLSSTWNRYGNSRKFPSHLPPNHQLQSVLANVWGVR